MWTIKWTKKNYYKVSQKIGRSFYVIVISEGECKNRKTSDKIGAVGISAHSTMSKSCQFFIGTNHDKILTAFMDLYIFV